MAKERLAAEELRMQRDAQKTEREAEIEVGDVECNESVGSFTQVQ